MANSYDVYVSTELLNLLTIDLSTGADFTSVSISDNDDGGSDDTNVLDLNEEFTGPDGGLLADDQYEYLGNLLDSEGNIVGFVASGPGLLLGNTSIFLPAGTDTTGLTFQETLDTENGWQIEDAAPNCFVDGTLIATPEGERQVETLQIGDMITTASGKIVEILWIGRQEIRKAAWHTDLGSDHAPVCIQAGALAPGLPHSDLYLSPEHALVIDDILINAGTLVNDTTIRFVPLAEMPEVFTYHHIETQDHDEILANGSVAETFVDYVGRQGFDNYPEYLELYGGERVIPEMRRLRISSKRQLPEAIRTRLGIASFAETVENEYQALLARLTAA